MSKKSDLEIELYIINNCPVTIDQIAWRFNISRAKAKRIVAALETQGDVYVQRNIMVYRNYSGYSYKKPKKDILDNFDDFKQLSKNIENLANELEQLGGEIDQKRNYTVTEAMVGMPGWFKHVAKNADAQKQVVYNSPKILQLRILQRLLQM